MMALNWAENQSKPRPVFRLVDRKKNGHSGRSNNTLNFYNLMTIRTYRNAFRNLTRDLVWRQPQPDCFGDTECLAIGIPVVEFKATGVSQPTMNATD